MSNGRRPVDRRKRLVSVWLAVPDLERLARVLAAEAERGELSPALAQLRLLAMNGARGQDIGTWS